MWKGKRWKGRKGDNNDNDNDNDDGDGNNDDATLSTSVTQHCTSNSLKKNQHQLPKSLPFHLDPNIICLIHVNLDKNPFWNLTSFLPQTKGILPQREKKMFFSIPI